MHAQVIAFAGPRTAEHLAASQRAGRERIAPLVESHPELRAGLLGGFRGVGPDGGEIVVELAVSEEVLETFERVVMSSELLPGEDPSLFTPPTRVERFTVTDTFGPLRSALGGEGA